MELKTPAAIERFLAAPAPSFRAACIHGPDQGLVRERAAALAARITERPDDPFDVAFVTEADAVADPGRLEGELGVVSMMGGRRLVRLRLAEARAAAVSLAVEALGGHLAGAYNAQAFLLIEAPALAAASPLRAAAAKAGACALVPCYEEDAPALAKLVREALAAEGLGLATDAVETFVAALPHDRGIVRSEIERLALFLGPGSGRTGGAAELDAFLGVEPEASLAGAANDAFGGRLAAAQAGLRRAAMEADAGAPAVRAMGRHLARLRRVLTQHEAGAGLAEAARSAGVFWKSEREFLRQARAWTLKTLDGLQADLLAADRACKQTGAPDALLAERLVLQVAARAQRLGL